MPPISIPQASPETAIVHVGRALDFRTALVFRALCQEQLDQGFTWFILDFSETGSLDATGLSAIFAIHRQASAKGGGIAFAALTRPMAHALEATQARVFARFATVSEAAEALNDSMGGIRFMALFAAFTQYATHTSRV